MKLIEQVEIARKLAHEGHEGQFRRDGITPYVEHPKQVVSRVGDDLNAQVVAWLHDILEDTHLSRVDLIESGISEENVRDIEFLTKDSGIPYLEYMENLKSKSNLAVKVKIADMLSNLADKPTKKQIKKYARGLLILLD